MNQTTSSIELLPEHIIDQIKAGEVVERPASLLKEIIENSIDAGATKIDLHLVGNAMELITLADNGHGMSYDDLPYAFCRHATSKIARFEDIYRLNTFGFRGEALASISSIAKITCISAPKGQLNQGGKITLEAGQVTSHSPEQGQSHGTTLFIKDLFYNTPARLKFVKSQTTEKNSIKKILESFIISNPHVTFTIKWDEQDKEVYPAVKPGDTVRKLKQIFYKKKDQDKEVITIDATYEGHRIRGHFSPESVKGHASRKQFLFANSRLFMDKQLHGLITRVMDGRAWFQGAGSYCLFIEAPPSQIDVNVHPNKTYIKFLKHSLILSLVSNEIKNVLKDKIGDRQDHLGQEMAPRPEHKAPTPLSQFTVSPYEKSSKPHSPPNDMFTGPDTALNTHVAATKPVKIDPIYQIYFDHEQGPFLIHKVSLLQQVFRKIKPQDLDDEFNMVPLLISEPLDPSIYSFNDRDLASLKALGFLVEKVSDELYALRGIHNDLATAAPKSLISILYQTQYNFDSIRELSFDLKETFIQEHLNTDFVIKLYSDASHTLFPIGQQNL